jgi:hypothetical protein
MNERIKKLKELATIETPAGHGIVKYVFSPEKFAELIVQECIEIANNVHMCRDGKVIAEDIKQHFGVEE